MNYSIHIYTCICSLRGSPLARLLESRTPGFRGVNVMTLATEGPRKTGTIEGYRVPEPTKSWSLLGSKKF